MTNILEFTKSIIGMDTISYALNYVDQNMILYLLLKNSSYQVISIQTNQCTVEYCVSGLSNNDMIYIMNTIPSIQQVSIYGKTYTVQLYNTAETLLFIIT